MKKLKKTIISASLVAYSLSLFPVSAFASTNNPVNLGMIEIDSDKIRDVYQDRGVAVGIYDPYQKNFKIFHYWIGVGNPKVDLTTNTDCSKPINAWIKVKHPERRVDTYSLTSKGYSCTTDSRDANITKCVSPQGTVKYITSDGYEANITPIRGAFCRRIVDDATLKNYLHLDTSKMNIQNVGTTASLNSTQPINNTVISNISYDDALDLLARYSKHNALTYAIMVVQTFDVYKTESSSLFRTTITYHFIEKPKYYILATGISAGTPYKYGYYLLDGQGLGNNLTRNDWEIFRKSQSGWTGLAMIVFQAAFMAVAWYAIGAIPAIAGMQNAVAIGMGINFFAQDIKNDVFSNLTGGKAYNVGTDLLVGGVLGGITGGTPLSAGAIGVGIISKDYYEKDMNVSTGDGADQIAQRVRSGTDISPNLSGFVETNQQIGTFQNWNKPAGGFITMPVGGF